MPHTVDARLDTVLGWRGARDRTHVRDWTAEVALGMGRRGVLLPDVQCICLMWCVHRSRVRGKYVRGEWAQHPRM